MSGIDPGASRPRQVERRDAVWRHISLVLSVFFRFFSSRAFPLRSCNTSTPPLRHPRSPSTRKFSGSSVILLRNVRSFRLHRHIRFDLIAATVVRMRQDKCDLLDATEATQNFVRSRRSSFKFHDIFTFSFHPNGRWLVGKREISSQGFPDDLS